MLCVLSGCAELQQVAGQYGLEVSQTEMAAGLREALKNGVEKQVTRLTEKDGFFRNEAVKILLPEELQKVDSALRKTGLASLADEGSKVLNRAAEDAVGEAIPVFQESVRQMTFTDAKNILFGNEDAATQYLQRTGSTALYTRFNPIVKSSLSKVGADQVWRNIITKYNALPLTTDVNPDLTDYVTRKAMDGVFVMVAREEKNIRTTVSARSSAVLQRVFALQDKR